MPPSNNNPYGNAASVYGGNAQKNASDPRELEAHVLNKHANLMQALQKDWDNVERAELEKVLYANRKLWVLFYDTALENPENERPADLRSNIVNLANFVFKREMEILNAPEKSKLDILIQINRDVAAGLLEGARNVGAQGGTNSGGEAGGGSQTEA